MATLQVSFHDTKLVKKVKVASRSNDIVNRLNRTKKELSPDLAGEREAYDREVRTRTTEPPKHLTMLTVKVALECRCDKKRRH